MSGTDGGRSPSVGRGEGQLEVALPHHGCKPTEAASRLLNRLPPYFQPGCLPAPDAMEPDDHEVATAKAAP